MSEGTAGLWRDRRVLVTGCTGLLGSWLSDWLSVAGAGVVGLVRDEVPQANFHRLGLVDRIVVVKGDVESYDALERVVNEYEIEVIFHLAAQTIVGIANENPRSTFATNVAGTWNVLEAARRSSRIRAVVLASSDKAYGTQPNLPYQENTPLEGRHPYDVSKSCADLIAQAYWHSYQLPVAITRCGNFFGGGDLNFNRLVPGTIRSLLYGERPIIRSDGRMKRDYLYVTDAVHAYVLLAQKLLEGHAAGRAYNFSTERPLTVMDMVGQIARVMGRTDLEPVVLNAVKNEIPDQYLSAARARTELDWQPRYTLEEGLKETVAWYERTLQDARARAVRPEAATS